MEKEKIPPIIKPFIGKSMPEIIRLMMPQVKNMEALAALYSGLKIDIGIPVPDWAKSASCRFFTSIGLDSSTEPNGELSTNLLGQLIGMAESSPLPKIVTSKQKKLASDLCNIAKASAADTSPREAKKFFDGRADAAKITTQLRFSPQRVKVYFIVAVAWQLVATFESSGELHRWLIDEKIILPKTDSAETRKMCRSIGLEFLSKPGRPRKNNPVTDGNS